MTKSKLHNALLAVTLAGGVFAGAGSAYATPNTDFFATNLLTFGTPTPTTGGTFVSTTPTTLEWVQESDARSFLRILPPANEEVTITSDTVDWTRVVQLQHENNVIAISQFGFTVDVSDQFTLTGATFDLTNSSSLPLVSLPLVFTETPNVSPESACGEPNPLESLCDDTFVIDGLGNVLGTFLFSAQGERWALSLRILAEEAEGSFFNGTDTIFTAEAFTSNVFIEARIDQLEVPEPATLALLGIGLLGLPLARARRAAKQADSLEA